LSDGLFASAAAASPATATTTAATGLSGTAECRLWIRGLFFGRLLLRRLFLGG
jgi:hypothetical protein